MLIKGRIFYNHDINNYTNFLYDLKNFETNKLQEVNSFSDKAMELNKTDLIKLTEKLEKIGAYFSPDELIFNNQDKQLVMDYLETYYPVSLKWSDITLNTLSDYLPYDITNDIIFLYDAIQSFYKGYSPLFGNPYIYEWIEMELGFGIAYLLENYEDYPEDLINYIADCYESATDMPDVECNYLERYFDTYIEDCVPYELLEQFELKRAARIKAENELKAVRKKALKEVSTDKAAA